jgi:hypothetical protein
MVLRSIVMVTSKALRVMRLKSPPYMKACEFAFQALQEVLADHAPSIKDAPCRTLTTAPNWKRLVASLLEVDAAGRAACEQRGRC